MMRSKTGFILITVASLILAGLGLQTILAEEIKIPEWIKNNAKWWSDGLIDDKTFASGLQFMIKEGIIKIPLTQSGQTKEDVKIPEWIKNNAKWWSDGLIDDKTFASGIQFMIKEGIVFVNIGNSQKTVSDVPDVSECEKYETPAEKRTCKKEIELATKIQNDIEKSPRYPIGHLNFYYVNNKIEETSQGGTILTIYLIVENTSNSDDVVLSCPVSSCNYVLSDGQKDIQYTTNTLVYGSLTLQPNEQKLLEWSFFKGLDYDPTKDYFFKINEPWGNGVIPLEID